MGTGEKLECFGSGVGRVPPGWEKKGAWKLEASSWAVPAAHSQLGRHHITAQLHSLIKGPPPLSPSPLPPNPGAGGF